ncbi:MAG: hypoxanthine phosphoribosyltransferase [Flavobacteriales bacterium]|nr:hypoxanthine phosphoribosyltransferase [Flavobacteriales bacterium]MBL6872965.1 hypoxanthine phosphoribosyltransferase [Flavobacteriales bacterium]
MVQILDKTFEPFLEQEDIQNIVSQVAKEMDILKNENPLFIIVLKGSFLFASDLLKALSFDSEITFMQIKSYEGTQSSGEIKDIMGVPMNLKDRTIVIIEDIVDTGNTLEYLYNRLSKENPSKIHIASLLLKPDVYSKEIPIDFVGKEIPNHFVVGYGLDYEELGRTLTQIYKLKNS